MTTFTFIKGIGHASECAVSKAHRPAPMRFVWHHILPQACGGLSVTTNLVALCDNCHYAVHVLLYQLKINGAVTASPVNNRARVVIALQGYRAAQAAGVIDKIPNEGAALH